MQYLNSRRGVYSGICALVVFACIIMLSGTMGLNSNTQEQGSNLVITGEGFFVHLTYGMMNVLVWGTLIGLLSLVVIGVLRRSMASTTLPGIVYIIAAAMVDPEYLQVYGGSWFTYHTVAVAGIMTLLGVLALTVFDRWMPAMIRRTPDKIPDNRVAEYEEEADRDADRGPHMGGLK